MPNSGSDSTDFFIALTAQIKALAKNIVYGAVSGANTNPRGDVGRINWRYNNSQNKTEMIRNDRKHKWCTKNYHNKPIWYACPNYLSKEEFAVKKKVERFGKADNVSTSKDFKVTLAAVTSNEDYKALEVQFLPKK